MFFLRAVIGSICSYENNERSRLLATPFFSSEYIVHPPSSLFLGVVGFYGLGLDDD